MDDKERMHHLKELMRIQTKNIDCLTEKMDRLEAYTQENNKVVNSILHKLDDHAEMFEKHDQNFDRILEEMGADRKLRDAQFELILKKFGQS
ncbi:MAG: hypothetical protein RIC53_16795 [Cyclobacteriaceae bacterium]